MGTVDGSPGTWTRTAVFQSAFSSLGSSGFCVAMTRLSLLMVMSNLERGSLKFSIKILLVISWYAVNNPELSTPEIAVAGPTSEQTAANAAFTSWPNFSLRQTSLPANRIPKKTEESIDMTRGWLWMAAIEMQSAGSQSNIAMSKSTRSGDGNEWLS
jgi:hypothetical protein